MLLLEELTDLTNLADSIDVEVENVNVENVELVTKQCDCDCCNE